MSVPAEPRAEIRPWPLRLVRLWWRLTLAFLAVLLVFVVGILVFNGSWRTHMLGLSEERRVTVASVDPGSERCGKSSSGDGVVLTWEDGGTTRSATWVACAGDRPVEAGDQLTLWVADGRRAYDYSPLSWWTTMPTTAPAVALFFAVLITVREGRRRSG